jgi:adenylate cyclase
VVDGSIRRMGDRIRISVRLTDADSGAQVWGERFDRASSEIFAVQDEVVQTIVSTLVGRVQSSHVERVRRKPPSSLEAYECVLQGNALPWADPAGAAEATRLFEKAIDIDPDYGLAHALLATMRCSKWKDSWSESTEDLDEAYRLAMRAVELDDSESTCHSLLSQVCLHRHAYELAEQHARRSVELNPTNQWNRADMGYVLLYLDRPEEALELFTRARQLDPYFDPPWYWQYAGLCCMVLRRFEDALEMFAHIRAPSYRIDAYRASCYARIGESAPARAAAAECIGKRPDFSIRRFVSREPFRNPNVAADLAEFLRLAGLPD